MLTKIVIKDCINCDANEPGFESRIDEQIVDGVLGTIWENEEEE